MRLIPFLTAVVVTAFLYLLVFERDALLAASRGDFAALQGVVTGEAPEAPEPGPESVAAADGEMEPEKAAPERAVRVVVMRSSARMIDNAVMVRGETQAARQVDMRAETSGQVVSEPLRKGERVETGDLLCRIDEGTRGASLAEARARLAEARARVPEVEARVPEAEARLEEARARVQEAEINNNASSKLVKDGFATETRVAATQAALRSAQAALSGAEASVKAARALRESADAAIESAAAGVAAAEREIARLEIRAPFGGLLESDTAELGSLLQPGGLCATILQLDPIRLVGYVPETEVVKVEVGAEAGARLASGGDVRGEVTFVSRSADKNTRTFRVEVLVPNESFAIGDGQTAEILIRAAGVAAHLVPQSALTLNDEGDLGLRLVDEADTARFYPVRLLRDTVMGAYVDGLPEEAVIITVGQEFVVDGVKVIPEFASAEVTQ